MYMYIYQQSASETLIPQIFHASNAVLKKNYNAKI